ncbi:P-loop containing nucleoside triphosphate hydrolase protein [Cokeromyces recurvatus]|uniref:P-loop containing nucleoside triphosphate hydrolase protein n=1 Tax=Cokeromyces recurvatus TaxID=90255 RepID=UPI002220C5CB|nr:P-loop containing nucleoside triphosphate hydrolase protein [Cokeromyces recurvatus]KAI7902923.1 P-loop containing nucleoside triphosphate hydrolase protein [Cokeromyces recurvatus]
MGKSRPRYNEKARASSMKPTQRPHPKARSGGLAPQMFDPEHKQSIITPNAAKATTTDNDTNELMIIPGQNDQSVEQKKHTTQSYKEPIKYMSKKKRRKLEKYIEQKLKKEARTGLLEKLSTASWSSDLLKSSKLIGRSGQTLREQLKQTLMEQKAGLTPTHTDVPLLIEKEVEEKPELFEINKEQQQQTIQTSIMGSALKDGPNMPLVKRKRKKKKSTIPAIAKKRYKQRKGMESDTSFDSSDSANDTSSDEDEQDVKNDKKPVDNELEDEKRQTHIEAIAEAIQHIPAEELVTKRHEAEVDDIKEQILKSHREGDLVNDQSKPFYVSVNRLPEIQAARLQLPVCGEEQVIMEAVRNNTVVIICGETGSGKTTQVPQFLYEAGWSHPDSDNPGLIGVTQPRRVATVSMANRVAQELNLSNKQVSYQIRYDATVSDETRIKFMTDGVLLREMSQDLLLTKYSTLIIDEAHERNLNTDILIGVVSRVLKLRAEMSQQDREKIKPLRVVIMSATLRVSDFTENTQLFAKIPPVINVNARQYPVSIHFNKRTPQDYVAEAYKKVTKIHERLPSGAILVFLTGQNEINQLCKKLRQRYPSLPAKASKNDRKKEKEAIALESKKEEIPVGKVDIEDEAIKLGEDEQIEDFDLDTDEEDDDDDILEGFDDDELVNDSHAPLHVLPLYSMLPTEAQLRVFEPPPEGTRLCVVATNVAETSVTIPGVRYVVDCGKSKERRYDVQTGVQSFEIGWTSKASAGQRAGRAGRTGPGHCYRLYSSAVFDHEFEQFSTPEIHRMPIEGVVLNMKAMHIDNVINFPFPTPPPRENLIKAEKLLGYLGAIEKTTKRITEFGQTMSLFPITPRFAKMLIIGQQHNCLPYVIAIVSALSVGDPFIQDYHLDDKHPDEEDENDNDDDEELQNLNNPAYIEKQQRKLIRKKYYTAQMKHAGLDPSSDILKLLNVVGAYEYAGATLKFCQDNFLRPKAMEEIRKLRRQLTNLVCSNFPEVDVCLDPKMPPPTATQLKVLKQVLTAGFIDSVAIRQDVLETGGGQGSKRYKNARNVPYRLLWHDEDAFVHPNSILYGQEPPEMLVYSELFKSQGGKMWMKGVTAVEPKWIAKIGKDLCSFGRPLEFPLPKFIGDKKDRKLVYVVPSFGPKSWPLPPIQVEQRREGTRWVTIM